MDGQAQNNGGIKNNGIDVFQYDKEQNGSAFLLTGMVRLKFFHGHTNALR
jgi:hypothetical protein